jgi:hypothetical protein
MLGQGRRLGVWNAANWGCRRTLKWQITSHEIVRSHVVVYLLDWNHVFIQTGDDNRKLILSRTVLASVLLYDFKPVLATAAVATMFHALIPDLFLGRD